MFALRALERFAISGLNRIDGETFDVKAYRVCPLERVTRIGGIAVPHHIHCVIDNFCRDEWAIRCDTHDNFSMFRLGCEDEALENILLGTSMAPNTQPFRLVDDFVIARLYRSRYDYGVKFPRSTKTANNMFKNRPLCE